MSIPTMLKSLKSIFSIAVITVGSLGSTVVSALDNTITARGNSNFFFFNDFELKSDSWTERQSVAAFTPERICLPWYLTKYNVQHVAGKIGNGIKPNWANGSALRTSKDIAVGNVYSINMWVDFTAANRPTTGSTVISLAARETGTYHHAVIVKATGRLGVRNTTFVDSGFDIRTLDGWKMLTMVTDGSTTKAYIDGIQVGNTMNVALNTNTAPIQVFGNYRSNNVNGDQYSMPFDEVAVYNKALTVQEMSTLFSSGNGIEAPKAGISNLQFYYGFEDDSTSSKLMNRSPTNLGYDGKQGCYMRFPESRGRGFENNGGARFDTNVFRYITMVYKLRPGTSINSLIREVNSAGTYINWESIRGTALGPYTSYPQIADWNEGGRLIDDNEWHVKTIKLPINRFFDALIWHGDAGLRDRTSIAGGTYNNDGLQGEFLIDGMFIHKNESDVAFLYNKEAEAKQCDFSDQSSVKVIDGVTCDVSGQKITFDNNIILKNGATLKLGAGSYFNIVNNHGITVDDRSKIITQGGGSIQINNTPMAGVCATTTPEAIENLGGGKVKTLIVAGGGGGGYNAGAGGGAGGLIYNTEVTVANRTYDVVVGRGGTGAINTDTAGKIGGDSSFRGFIAKGGGGGVSNGGAGVAGGNGGGGAESGVGGNGTDGQGNKGGNGNGQTGAQRCGGGGGGAGAVGSNVANSSTPGNGGVGIQNNITGTNIWYAGGGAGACHVGTAGTGGNGGGGNSPAGTRPGSWNAGTAGTANTGGGGGAGSGGGGNGGNGGAGVVIIAYPTGSMTATGGTITTSGGMTIHTFTTNGTFTVTQTPDADFSSLCALGNGSPTDLSATDGNYDWTCGGSDEATEVATQCTLPKVAASTTTTKRFTFGGMSGSAPWSNYCTNGKCTVNADNLYTRTNDGNLNVRNTDANNLIPMAGKTLVGFAGKFQYHARSNDCWSDGAGVYFDNKSASANNNEGFGFRFSNDGSSAWRYNNAGGTCDVRFGAGKYGALNACAGGRYLMATMWKPRAADTTKNYYQYYFNLNDLAVPARYTFEPSVDFENNKFTLKVRNSSNTLVKDVTVTGIPSPGNNYVASGYSASLNPGANTHTSCTGPLNNYPYWIEGTYK